MVCVGVRVWVCREPMVKASASHHTPWRATNARHTKCLTNTRESRAPLVVETADTAVVQMKGGEIVPWTVAIADTQIRVWGVRK